MTKMVKKSVKSIIGFAYLRTKPEVRNSKVSLKIYIFFRVYSIINI